ncbi:hypothetical protein [Acinetobacter pittii]|uniref:hypothetical protein n=1 Tax=Acinetobacter pittii TaxID=48296 RepID=UPI00301A4F57
MDKFEEYFRTTERYLDFLCWGSDKWIFKSVDGRYLSEEIQRLYEVWQHQQAKVEELQKRVDFLEKHLKPCECGSKEIYVDQEGYITKHCYRCGGIKTQEMIEQALKGEG